ncbi:hypothetical protein GO755_02195 [Spirosoma sp. HMF4905]|uniref:Uncharacterized protein n=1 Tax=Spirosoma arboris TaxID=2682092 RepID=A0A7K1S5E7_9BACT|nr:hypothetical protein [Spirosoma arboris]MVM28828.1 hypothetical protein [Spirosoma arboris]
MCIGSPKLKGDDHLNRKDEYGLLTDERSHPFSYSYQTIDNRLPQMALPAAYNLPQQGKIAV